MVYYDDNGSWFYGLFANCETNLLLTASIYLKQCKFINLPVFHNVQEKKSGFYRVFAPK